MVICIFGSLGGCAEDASQSAAQDETGNLYRYIGGACCHKASNADNSSDTAQDQAAAALQAWLGLTPGLTRYIYIYIYIYTSQPWG